MKKVLPILFCMLLLCGALCFAVSAEDTVTVTVSIPAQTDVKAGAIEFTYDSSKMEIVGGEWTLSRDPMISDFNMQNEQGVFAYVSAVSLSGNVFKLTIRLKGGAAFPDADLVARFMYKDSGEVSHTVDAVACAHDFSAKDTAAKYRKSAADCTSAATYYYSCAYCGQKGSATFTDGDPLPHTFDRAVAEDAFLKEVASCQGPASYYYSCECGAVGTESFTDGAPADHIFLNDCDTTCEKCDFTREITHVYGEEYQSDATHHWHACTVCGERKDSAKHVWDAKAEKCTVCAYAVPGAQDRPSLLWQAQSGDLTIRSAEPFAEFIGVSINGEMLSADCYTVREGSTVVTVHADYLKTLGAGEYTLVVHSENGISAAEISIDASAANGGAENGGAENEAQGSSVGYVVGICILAVIAVAEAAVLCVLLVRKKKQR